MNVIKYLWRESHWLLLLSSACAIASGIIGAALVGIIGDRVDGGAATAREAGLFFACCLALVATQIISEAALLNLTQTAMLGLRLRLSGKVLATPLKDLQQLGTHGVLTVLTRDIDMLVESFNLMPMVFGGIILIVACLGYLAWVSWPMFLILAVCGGGGMFAFHLAEQQPHKLLVTVRERVDVLYKNFGDLIDGARELKLNAGRALAFVDKVIGGGARQYRDINDRCYVGYIFVINGGSVMLYLAVGLALFIVPVWLPLSHGKLTVVTMVLLYVVSPIRELMVTLPTVRQASVALQKIQQLDGDLREPAPTLMGPNPFMRPESMVLELDGVTYLYSSADHDRPFRLGPIDLRLRQGEIVFMAGCNGSGKTTLAMLLLGLYETEAGSIRLNGVTVNERNVDHYRQHFSAVFSDFHLFEELLIDGPEVGDGVAHYLRALRMNHRVEVVKGRFSTIHLSTGQRKRLALVATYLEDRPIYLFDEWAADQDPAFKRVFYTELLPELKSRGKTAIVITHDEAYFEYADRILHLEEGQLTHVASSKPPVCSRSTVSAATAPLINEEYRL
jgi:putative ATP-binding cassette transporter